MLIPYRLVVSILFFSMALSACVTAPELPGERIFPVEEILRTATCDLQKGFFAVADNKSFKAEKWLISVKLIPKAFTDLNASIGGTRKSTSLPNWPRIITWTFGTPGASIDIKGTQSGDATFEIKSAMLLDVKLDHPECGTSTGRVHELRNRLGIADWLLRTSDALVGDPRINRMNALGFTTDIIVRFAANGAYSYVMPKGSDLAGLGGWYEIQKTLTITLAPLAPVPYRPVVSLPCGGPQFGKCRTANILARDEAAAVENARRQNELNMLQQSIQGLRFPQ